MIIYALFIVVAGIGLGFFLMGVTEEVNLFAVIGPALGSPGFLPISLGWFLLSFILMFFAIVGIFIRIKMTGCSKRFDKPPPGMGIFNFIYRDGLSLDVFGKRRSGMGLFDISNLGVVVDVGRMPNPGSVYTFGGKKIRFALQDINFTPNPKFSNIYTFFADLGFNNMDDVYDVLTGYNPQLMVEVWNKLCEYHPSRLEDKIVDNIKEMSNAEIQQANQQWAGEVKIEKDIHKEIDKKLGGE